MSYSKGRMPCCRSYQHKKCDRCRLPDKCVPCAYHDRDEIPRKLRDMYDIGPYRINSVQCTKCEQTITSRNRHDFVTCKCGAISVDGGSWYLKRSGSPMDYMELSKSYADE